MEISKQVESLSIFGANYCFNMFKQGVKGLVILGGATLVFSVVADILEMERR